MNAGHIVVWNGSRATDPYLCVNADVVRPMEMMISAMTPERCAEIVAYAQSHGVTATATRYTLSGYVIGWLRRKAKWQA